MEVKLNYDNDKGHLKLKKTGSSNKQNPTNQMGSNANDQNSNNFQQKRNEDAPKEQEETDELVKWFTKEFKKPKKLC